MRPTAVALVHLGLTSLPELARAIEGYCGANNGDACFSCTRADGSCTVDADCFGSSQRNGGCRCEHPWEGPRSYQPRHAECRSSSHVECSAVGDREYCDFVDDCTWNSEKGTCEQNWLGIVVVLAILVLGGGGILGIWFCRSQGYLCSTGRRGGNPLATMNGRFPSHWGEPPTVQTQDLRPLPGGYGMGSSTLACWIEAKMTADAAAMQTQPVQAIVAANVVVVQPTHYQPATATPMGGAYP
jgi:hypothetical protein